MAWRQTEYDVICKQLISESVQKMRRSKLHIPLSQVDNSMPTDVISMITCNICLGLAVQPCECSKCQTLYCSQQISTMMDKVCPICSGTIFKPSDSIHKAYRALYRTMQLECECCDKKVLYRGYGAHIQRCWKDNESRWKAEAKDHYYNFFFANTEETMPYDTLSVVSMNVNLREGIDKFRLDHYAIDLNKLQQLNTNSGSKWKITRSKDKSHKQQPYWLVWRTHNPNDTYSYELQGLLEGAYQRWLAAGKPSDSQEFFFSMDNKTYAVDFVRMTQTNIGSKRSRKVNRVII